MVVQLGCGVYITKVSILIDATVQMDEDTYTVGEGDGSVEVCVEIGNVPSGALECELVVNLTISSGTKTGMCCLSMKIEICA